MLAMGRAMMSNPRYLLLDEPSLGLAPKLVDQVRDVIVEINETGTGILLVEQNATMALSIAGHGYVMETGRIVLDKPAAALLEGRGRPRVLPRPPPGRGRRGASAPVVPRRQALPPQEAVVGMTGVDPVVRLEDVHLSFKGVRAIDGVSFEVHPGELFAIIGPNGAGKTSIVQRAVRRLPPAAGQRRAAGGEHPRAQAVRHRRAGPGPHLPEHRAVRAPHRPRQPDAGPAPAHRLRLGGRLRLAAGGPRSRRSRTGGSSRRSSTSSRSSSGASSRSACCRTASRSGSSSAGRWRWSRSSSCSTSRWRA